MEFQKFSKIPRLSRECVITEKIDGTNGQIFIVRYDDFWKLHENYAGDSVQAFLDKYCLYKTLPMQDENDILYMFAGFRRKWLDIHNDNFGFANWVKANAEELFKLGEGRHYGEWWGKEIQRGYGLEEKRFSLFNVNKWFDERNGILDKEDKLKYCPNCCYVVPILSVGIFNSTRINKCLALLKSKGSYVSPGFMNPEGIVIYHKDSGQLFKKTIDNDKKPKNYNT